MIGQLISHFLCQVMQYWQNAGASLRYRVYVYTDPHIVCASFFGLFVINMPCAILYMFLLLRQRINKIERTNECLMFVVSYFVFLSGLLEGRVGRGG
jgi:hypothetical protein